METKRKSTIAKDQKINSSLIVLGLTGFSYVVAYVFQWSYLRHFGINYKFIDISPPLIIVSVMFTFVGYAALLPFLKQNVQLSNLINRGPLSKYVANQLRVGFILFLICYFILGSLGISGWQGLWVALGISVIITFLPDAEAIIWIVLKRSFRGGLLAYHKDKSKMYANQTKAGLDSPIDYYLEYVIFATLIMSLSLFIGKQYAVIDSTHLPVISNENNITRVLITRSGDSLVAKDYISDTKEPVGGYVIMNVQDKSPLEIRDKFNAQNE